MIEYIESADTGGYFYPQAMKKAMKTMERLFPNGDRVKISLYPDAVFKSNGLPTGLAIQSLLEESILLPHVLRDPGCGFLSFKLHFLHQAEADWHLKIGPKLDRLLNEVDNKRRNALKKTMLQKTSLEDILYHGLNAICPPEEQKFFANLNFPVSNDRVRLTSKEINTLGKDLFTLTNTLEIRTPQQINDRAGNYGIKSNDLVGFVHSGCHQFPSVLQERFLLSICDYAYFHHIASLAMIRKGFFGVPLQSDLGMSFYEWLKSAMNYALVSRYGLFLLIKNFFEEECDAEVSLINDKVHAGIWEHKEKNKISTVSTRGVQEISSTLSSAHQSIGILAGNRETIAFLVSSGDSVSEEGALFSHGTNPKIHYNFDYTSKFHNFQAQELLLCAKNAYYNTTPHFEECLPLTYNLVSALDCFRQKGILKPVVSLTPLINIFGNALKRSWLI